MIKDLQKPAAWKFQLTTAINFISSKDVHEELVMNSKGNNTELMTYDNANGAAHELYESLLWRYQISLGASMRGSNFVYDSVQMLY